MTTPLLPIMIEAIKRDGPMEIGAYMDMAMGHPEHGYYVTRDPLGNDGDFTTAPEISQMFGELIGAFFIYQWEGFGEPEKFTLLECGPGKGTLMADITRVIRNYSEKMNEALSIHLVEISPILRKRQAEILPEYEPVWHNDISTVPENAPIFMIGNEFLDVLPFRQFVKTEEGWQERFVDYDDERGLHFIAAPSRDDAHLSLVLPHPDEKIPVGEVFEQSPARKAFVKELCSKIKKSRGIALLIDYGYAKTDVGDSFQALRDKKSCHVLDHVGEADLTSQVNFQDVAEVAQDLYVSGPLTQGQFLRQLGIETRAAALSDAAEDEEQVEMIRKALYRLIDPDEMGALFKVIGMSHVG